jgi:hypothetical protein
MHRFIKSNALHYDGFVNSGKRVPRPRLSLGIDDLRFNKPLVT